MPGRVDGRRDTLMQIDESAARFVDAGGVPLLGSGRRIGLEKEALRVDHNLGIATTPHPRALGSALTHPYITTDYSEALLELITPPMPDSEAAIVFLEDVHTYVSRHLGEEMLWVNSMPCVAKKGTGIPLARYGNSNAGQMKTIYRRGLGHRYGRSMQTIAGVHFNYSFDPALWPCLRDGGLLSLPPGTSEQAARSQGYMALIRNLLRIGWVVTYLFGSSPAVCKAFAASSGQIESFDDETLFGRYATSLRMGDIGYQNNQESEAGMIEVSYDSLSGYLDSLKRAVTTPHARYRRHGVKVNGRFEQLNANILQIENEHYSTVRPKHTSSKGQMPLLALYQGGVEYIELRSLDVGTFDRAGVNAAQLDFLEVLVLFCLLADSPPLRPSEQRESNHNEVKTAHRGREKAVKLLCAGQEKPLLQWGRELCEQMVPASELLDRADGTHRYSRALDTQSRLFDDPEATPAARFIKEMRDNRECFVETIWRKSQEFGEYFRSRPLSEARVRQFDSLAVESWEQCAAIEAADRISLDAYIERYFSQLQEIGRAET